MRFAKLIALGVALSLLGGQASAAEKSLVTTPPPRVDAVRLPVPDALPAPGALAISGDQRVGVFVAKDDSVVLWDTKSNKVVGKFALADQKPSAVALNSDGSLLVVGYFSGRIVVKPASTNKVLRQLYGHSGGISAIAFSADDARLATGSADGTTQVWELANGRRLHVFDSDLGDDEHSIGTPVGLSFSGDGRALVVNEWYSRFYDVGRGITIWDLDEGFETWTAEMTPPNMDTFMRNGLAVGGRGWLLAYPSQDGLIVKRLDFCDKSVEWPKGRYASTVAADPLGRWVAAMDLEDNNKLVFTTFDGQGVPVILNLGGNAISLVSTGDGKTIYAMLLTETTPHGNDRIIIGRDAESVATAAIYSVAVPDRFLRLKPAEVASDATRCGPTQAQRDKQYLAPDKIPELPVLARLAPPREVFVDTPEPSHESQKNKIGKPVDIYFGDKGELYVLHYDRSTESGVAVWDPRAKRLLRSHFDRAWADRAWRLPIGWGTAQVLSEGYRVTDLLTGKSYVVAKQPNDPDGYEPYIDPDTGRSYRAIGDRLERYSAEGQRLRDVPIKNVETYAVRGGRVVAMLKGGGVHVWDSNNGAFKKWPAPEGYEDSGGCGLGALQISPNGRYMQTAEECNDVPTHYSLSDLENQRSVGHGPLLAPFPRNANRAVVPDRRPHRLAVLDLEKGEIFARLPRHRSRDKEGGYMQLIAAMSDDGRLVASTSFDGTVRVWDIDAKRVVGEARVGGAVSALAFDAAGSLLAAARLTGEIVVVELPATR